MLKCPNLLTSSGLNK